MTNYAFTSVELPINKNLLTPFSFGSNPLHPMDYDYHWVFIVACIAAFITAYALGANDVANSFAPSVGAKTLRLWQACLVAAFCEFFGAYLLGARSTDTIKSKIVSLSAFYGSDDILMFGMLCSDFGAGIWMLTATRFELHVSSTHSIIGAIIGMSLAARGAYAVNWPSVGLIIASWFISPILSGIISAGLFVLVRRFILRSENSFDRALKFYPIILAITLSLQISFILIKAGIANGRIKNLSQNDAIGVACAAGFGFAILFYFTVLSQVRKRYQGYPEEDPEETERKLRQAAKQAELNDKEAQNGKDSEEKSSEEKPAEETTALAYADADAQQQPTSADATNGKSEQDKVEPEKSEHPTGVNRGISFKPTEKTNAQLKIDKVLGGGKLLHSVVETNKKVENIHDSAEVFPYRTECVFAVLQVFTACCASFSHGANDVANAVGPLATVSAIYDTGSVAKASKVSVPDWILLLGAAGIVIGLSTYGWKILGAMGVKMVKLTPSRGFAIELGASIVILVGSSLGIPLSTTHCTTGSTVAIGLAEGKLGSVNWKLFGKMAAAWMVTLIMAGANAALLFSFATWAPSQYYPASQSNCLYLYGQVFNATTTGYSGNVQVPQYQGSVSVLAGYPANGAFVNIMQYNPPKP